MFIRLQSGRKRGLLTFNVANIESYGPSDGSGDVIEFTMTSGKTHQIPTTMDVVDGLMGKVRGVSIVDGTHDIDRAATSRTGLSDQVSPDTHRADSALPEAALPGATNQPTVPPSGKPLAKV